MVGSTQNQYRQKWPRKVKGALTSDLFLCELISLTGNKDYMITMLTTPQQQQQKMKWRISVETVVANYASDPKCKLGATG